MILKIAVVDDEPEILKTVIRLLRNYELSHAEDLSFEVDTFLSGDAFLESNPNLYDVVFLDIVMPGTDGLRVAKVIRERNKLTVIIFCTKFNNYALKGYDVNAMGYILKPIEESLFYGSLDRVVKALGNLQTRKLKIKTLHGIEIVPVTFIAYIEIQTHNLYYYVLNFDGKLIQYRSRGSMQEIADSLTDMEFAKCSACYLVNLRHVTSVTNGEVKLHGGASLPISRRFLKSFKEEFVRFLIRTGKLNNE